MACGEPDGGAALARGAGLERATIESLLERVEANDLRYVFVGERHDVGPVKRFAVDVANALVEVGHDVGLYVEGFRAECDHDSSCSEPGSASSDSLGPPELAKLFNEEAFARLRAESRAPVYGLDPRGRNSRVDRMAATLTSAAERVRVVLVGNSHVVYAGDRDAEFLVYGGSVRFPNPGDLVEALPRGEVVVVALEPEPERSELEAPDSLARGLSAESTAADRGEPYALIEGGCRADYRLVAPYRRDY